MKNDIYRLDQLVGMTLLKISAGDDYVSITTNVGRYQLYHSQDCCECVRITEVEGDLSEMEGLEIERAEEEVDCDHGSTYGTGTQTTYTLKAKGLDKVFKIIWLGESNGYYSESVSFSAC